MKDIITRMIWKIQQLTTTQLYELFLWFIISGVLYEFILKYITSNYMYNIYIDIFLFLFIYYSGYKLILK